MSEENFSVAFNGVPGKGELTVLFSGKSQTLPLHQVGPQVLDYYLVHYVIRGQGHFRILGRDYPVHAGDSFFIYPGELVSYTSSAEDPWLYRWIGFKGARAEELLSHCGITRHKPVAGTGNKRRMIALFAQMERLLHAGQASCDLQSSGYMRLILSEYMQGQSAASEPKEESSMIVQQVEQAIRWLTLRYYQEISIEQMAQTLGYHRTHLSKMFKQHTGMSPMNFLLKIRMERAKHLLMQEKLTIEQVASSVGFSDPLYFSKQFKKWYGRSPSDYRQDHSANPFDCSR
jgi:AraC-like DNA-binding protein